MAVLANLKAVFGYEGSVASAAMDNDGSICPMKLAALDAQRKPLDHVRAMTEGGVELLVEGDD